MKNWNTDTSKFTSARDKKIWELKQKIEYGLDKVPLLRKELITYWDDSN